MQVNPKGKDEGSCCVYRGGSWYVLFRHGRVAYRCCDSSIVTSGRVGVRVAMGVVHARKS